MSTIVQLNSTPATIGQTAPYDETTFRNVCGIHATGNTTMSNAAIPARAPRVDQIAAAQSAKTTATKRCTVTQVGSGRR